MRLERCRDLLAELEDVFTADEEPKIILNVHQTSPAAG
jgi:hypothetical protein